MKGNQEVINALNAGLTIELTAINQYFICAKMCKNWGLNKLAAHFYAESIEEMKHAEEVIDRILYLEGIPEIARYDKILVGDSPQQQIQDSLTLEPRLARRASVALISSARRARCSSLTESIR